MAYFDCIVGGSGKGNTLVVTCADELAGATITCTNGTKTYRKTCPSTAPYEVTFYGLEAGTWTVSATVSGNTYTTTVVITDYEAELGGFNWKAWVDLSQNYTSSDFTDLDDLLSDETAIRELMTIHACVDYLAGIAAESADVETIIGNDLCAKWINLRDYALDTLYANTIIKGYMDTADKYFYGEWCLMPQVPTMTSNTTPYGVASASSEFNTNAQAWKAFDGIDVTTRWTGATTLTSGCYLQYVFNNVVEINEIRASMSNATNKVHKETWKLQTSNDGSTWNDVPSSECEFEWTSTADTPVSNGVIFQETVSSRYFRFIMVSSTEAVHGAIWELQFYAWAPKGNVPVMTANNAPYGECGASSYASSSQYPAYKAFDGINSVGGTDMWNSANGSYTNQWIYFKFPHPVCIKKVIYASAFQVGYTPKNIIIQGSNDGTAYKDLKNFLGENITADQTIDVSSNDEYFLYGRFYITDSYSTGTMTVTISKLQFYGRELWKQENSQYVPDYSEKEFEEGTTKKWLYDHGLELETMDYTTCKSSGASQGNDSESIWQTCGTASNGYVYALTNSAIDLTDYNYLFVKLGNKLSAASSQSVLSLAAFSQKPTNYDTIATYRVAFNGVNLPVTNLNFAVDVSSINQSEIIGVGQRGATTHYNTVTEWWLE